MDKFSGHILGRFAGRPLESPRHPIYAAEGCFYPTLVNTSPRPSFWLKDGFLIVIQLRPIGLSSYGLSARFATIPSTSTSQDHSLFTGEQAARPLLTISFRPSRGPLVEVRRFQCPTTAFRLTRPREPRVFMRRRRGYRELDSRDRRARGPRAHGSALSRRGHRYSRRRWLDPGKCAYIPCWCGHKSFRPK